MYNETIEKMAYRSLNLDLQYGSIKLAYSEPKDKFKLERATREYAEEKLLLLKDFEISIHNTPSDEKKRYLDMFDWVQKLSEDSKLRIYKAFLRNASKTGYLPDFLLRKEFLAMKNIRGLSNIGDGGSLSRIIFEKCDKLGELELEEERKAKRYIYLSDLMNRSMNQEEYKTLMKGIGLD